MCSKTEGWPTSAATRNTDSGISRSSQSAKNPSTSAQCQWHWRNALSPRTPKNLPTFNVEIVEDQIIVVATITVPPDNPKTEPFKALVDTGSQVTMISQKVVDAIQADPVGQGSILPASGEPVETPQYRLGIHIAVGIGLSQTFSAG